jgi:hypothetical protein
MGWNTQNLKFMALQGALYIYDISRLMVKSPWRIRQGLHIRGDEGTLGPPTPSTPLTSLKTGFLPMIAIRT